MILKKISWTILVYCRVQVERGYSAMSCLLLFRKIKTTLFNWLPKTGLKTCLNLQNKKKKLHNV